MDNNQGNNGNNNRSPQNGSTLFIVLIASLVLILILSYMRSILNSATNQKISYDEFIKKVEAGEIESVEITADTITVTPKKQANPIIPTTYYTVRVADDNLADRLLNAGVKFEQKETSSSDTIMYFIGSYILPLVIFWALMSFIMRRVSKGGGGGIMGVGKSNAKVYVQKETGVTFRDVAGQEEAK